MTSNVQIPVPVLVLNLSLKPVLGLWLLGWQKVVLIMSQFLAMMEAPEPVAGQALNTPDYHGNWVWRKPIKSLP
jgi:hypothetical protein